MLIIYLRYNCLKFFLRKDREEALKCIVSIGNVTEPQAIEEKAYTAVQE